MNFKLCRTFMPLFIILLSNGIYSQSNLKDEYGITGIERILYQGDSVYAIYKAKNKYNHNVHAPDTLPSAKNGKYIVFTTYNDTAANIITEIGEYKNSKKEGLWIYYGMDGICNLKHNYSNGKFEGLQEIFDSDGDILYYYTIENDKINGKALLHYRHEGIYGLVNYKNDTIVGREVRFHKGVDTSEFKIEIYHSGYSNYLYAKKIYMNDTLIEELYLNDNYRILYKNGVLVEKVNLNKKNKTSKKANKDSYKNNILKNIYFDSSYSHLDTNSYKSLDKLIETINTYDNKTIELFFHTLYPIEEVNPLWIMEVITYLKENGIKPSNIYPKHYSNTQPIYEKENKKKLNQRIEWRFKD